MSMLLLACAVAHVQAAPRFTEPLNQGWRFQQAELTAAAAEATFDDSHWARITVPHTWNRLGNAGVERAPESNSTQGVGWYRLHFNAPAMAPDSRSFLQFDAVAAVADVWLNGTYLGKHAGAFARFRLDATAALHRHGDNLLVVRADNSRPQPGSSTENVIPLAGDFFVFGGIYRNVSLVITHPLHADLMDYGGPGLYAVTTHIDPDAAEVRLWSTVVDDSGKAGAVTGQFSILDAQGREVASASVRGSAGKTPTLLQAELHVSKPRLWRGTLDPYLYRAVMSLKSRSGQTVDRLTQPFGVRSMTLDANRGFLLNDQPVRLNGVSRHQDRPVKGWAISEADQDEDFDLMQEMGANAVRLAHYQHDQHSYDLADSRGLTVWAEIPVVTKVSFDGRPANQALTANARQQLLELIHQNRNHPSIAVWSIGNEVDLAPTQVHGPSHPAALLKSLQQLARSEDSSRPITLADCCEVGLPPHPASASSNEREAVFDIADTLGYNRYFGWYAGSFGDFGLMLDGAHARHPLTPIAVSEYGAGGALTQHTDDPRGGNINPHGRPHPEEFQNLYHEESWAALKARPYLWGTFVWNMFDFSSDSRREGDLTDINEKGLVSYDRRTRKDSFYFYKANWSPSPTLHLVGSRNSIRDYSVVDVKAYSNAPDAHLRVNDTDQGNVHCEGGVCVWRAVHLAEGENRLVASARISGKTVTDGLLWSLPHSPGVVRIKAGDISGLSSADGTRYGSDLYFSGGVANGINPPDTADADRRVLKASFPKECETFREGQFSYRVPLPNGAYRVTLEFAEPSLGVGERLFDVSANNVPQLSNLDIHLAAGGTQTGIERAFDVSVVESSLSLDFRPRRGQALLCSLSITPLERR